MLPGLCFACANKPSRQLLCVCLTLLVRGARQQARGGSNGVGRLDTHMAKLIDDGLAAYELELTGSKQRSASVRPPKGPGAGARFFGSSAREYTGAHMPRQRHAHGPAGESPPSHAFGWLMGTSPDGSGSLMGTSPAGSYRSRGRCVRWMFGVVCIRHRW